MLWWQWLLLAAADFEGNYLLVLAYQYTDITSVCMLDAFTIPTVILLSRAFGRRYGCQQLFAATLCVLGIALLVAADVMQQRRQEYGSSRGTHSIGVDTEEPDPSAGSARAWVGDLLVLAGAALYGCSNVVQERFVSRQRGNRVDYLAHLGSYGALVAVAQAALLEREALLPIRQAWHEGSLEQPAAGRLATPNHLAQLVGLEAGFVLSLSAFYVLVAWLLEHGSSATTMNLSLLTSDFWSVLVGIGLLHSRPDATYAAAFSLTVGGLLLYHGLSPPAEAPAPTRERQGAQSTQPTRSSALAEPLIP